MFEGGWSQATDSGPCHRESSGQAGEGGDAALIAVKGRIDRLARFYFRASVFVLKSSKRSYCRGDAAPPDKHVALAFDPGVGLREAGTLKEEAPPGHPRRPDGPPAVDFGVPAGTIIQSSLHPSSIGSTGPTIRMRDPNQAVRRQFSPFPSGEPQSIFASFRALLSQSRC